MHRRGHEAEMMPNGSEMKTLGPEAAEEDEEPHSTSENSQRNIQQEVKRWSVNSLVD